VETGIVGDVTVLACGVGGVAGVVRGFFGGGGWVGGGGFGGLGGGGVFVFFLGGFPGWGGGWGLCVGGGGAPIAPSLLDF